MTQPDLPSVALIVPVRNESEHIDACLASLSAQTYPRDRLRVVVTDGDSTDDTVERIRRWAARDRRISLRRNANRVMTAGLNQGLDATDAEVVGVISGHSTVEPDYVERAIDALERTGAWCVGGRVVREAATPVQRAIARATSSPVGVGDSRHNYATESGWAEAAFPGIWPRWVFDRIGKFDAEMPFNEDNELAYRILAAGGRIWFDAAIVVHYVPRGSLGSVFTQYRRYGRGKVSVFRKHRGAFRWRHAVPPAWVAWVPAVTVAGLVRPVAWLASLGSVGVYGALMVVAALRNRRPSDSVLLTAAAFAAIHAGYGIGVWQGVVDLIRGR